MAEKIEEPTGKALADLRRQRDERQIRIEEEKRGGAPTPQRPVNTPKPDRGANYKKGGSVKSSASRRADGIAQRGKTRGRLM